MNIFDSQIIRSVKTTQCAVHKRKDTAFHCQSIGNAVRTCFETSYIFRVDHGIIDHGKSASGIYESHTLCRGHIDPAIGTFSKRSYGSRRKAVLFAVHLYITISVHNGSTVVIGSYPKAVTAVNEQAYDACDTCCGFISLERIAVISDKTAVASDPDKAVGCLCYGISLRCGKTGSIVIKIGCIAFHILRRIDIIATVSVDQNRRSGHEHT